MTSLRGTSDDVTVDKNQLPLTGRVTAAAAYHLQPFKSRTLRSAGCAKALNNKSSRVETLQSTTLRISVSDSESNIECSASVIQT